MKMNVSAYSLLEYLAFWEGELTAKRLASLIGQEREHVQRAVIGPYRREFPQALARSNRRKSTFADTAEGLRYAPATVANLIDMLTGFQVLHNSAGSQTPFPVKVEHVVTAAYPDPDPEVFKYLFAGCAQQRAVLLEYRSKSGVSILHFSPHSLVKTKERIHFRGFASWEGDRPGQYIDLVPARVIGIFSSDKERFVSSTADLEWHERVDLNFILHPGLPENLRQVIIQENEWDNSQPRPEELRISAVRIAMKRYVIQSVRFRIFNESVYDVWVPK